MQFTGILFSLSLIKVTLNVTFGAKILLFFTISSYSHRIAVWPYVEKLAATGHEVTLVQPHPPKKPNPNVTEFYPQSMLNAGGSFVENINLLKLRLEGGKPAVDAILKSLMDEDDHALLKVSEIPREERMDFQVKV